EKKTYGGAASHGGTEKKTYGSSASHGGAEKKTYGGTGAKKAFGSDGNRAKHNTGSEKYKK
ncbi:MAG: hypothetical protein RR009_03325, partial [Oscillospiraceae bacterium]